MSKEEVINIFGDKIEACCHDPVTGYFRDGFCNTDEHDFQFKLKHAKSFLQDGAKVKAFVFFRGRTIIFKDKGQILLLKLAQALEDVGVVESMPELDKRRKRNIWNYSKK